jgi:hypothetical protein
VDTLLRAIMNKNGIIVVEQSSSTKIDKKNFGQFFQKDLFLTLR